MIVTNLNQAPGYVVTELLGIAKGSIAQGSGSLGAVVDSIQQAESEEYTTLMEKCRLEAERRMRAHAKRMEADAVLGVTYTMTPIGTAQAMDVYCYGTAVKLRPE